MLAAGHPEIARDLAARFRTDRRAYAAAKDAFCARIDRLVRGL